MDARDVTKVMRELHPRPVRLRVRDISLPGYRTQFLMVLPQAAATNHASAWLADYLHRHLPSTPVVLVRQTRVINRRDCGHDTEWVITVAEWRRDDSPPGRWVVRDDRDEVIRQISDAAITTYGRSHIEGLVAKIAMPPLPEDAWAVLA